MSTMHGLIDGPRFSDLFADTLHTCGLAWAWAYYAKRGMARWEFRFWVRQALGV